VCEHHGFVAKDELLQVPATSFGVDIMMKAYIPSLFSEWYSSCCMARLSQDVGKRFIIRSFCMELVKFDVAQNTGARDVTSYLGTHSESLFGSQPPTLFTTTSIP
jgi:hypothetical protein